MRASVAVVVGAMAFAVGLGHASETVSLRQGLPVPVEPAILAVPGAFGPEALTCREALGLPTAAPSPGPPPEPRGEEPAPTPPVLTLEGSGDQIAWKQFADPSELPLRRLEGPPDALRSVARVMAKGERGGRVRMSFFGASHTGADWWTGQIRRVLQDRWGDLGHGFVLPAALYKGYRGTDVNLCRTDGWRPDWAGKRDSRDDGLHGFAGMSVSSDDPQDFGWIETTRTNPHGRKVDWFDVYSLGQPSGGTLNFSVDGAAGQAISTAADEPMLLRHRILVGDGSHRLTLAPAGDAEVRLFGVSLERDGPGALVDAMGIRGRQAKTWLEWDDTLFGQGLASLDPDLVVLAYGTNEAADTRYSMEAYEADLRAVLTKLRAAFPEPRACVLVGPGDRVKRHRDGRYTLWTRTRPVVEVQGKVAPEFGCAFWDWQAAGGGEGSFLRWREQDPPLAAGDGIHFTRAGYQLVADQFIAALDDLKRDPRLK